MAFSLRHYFGFGRRAVLLNHIARFLVMKLLISCSIPKSFVLRSKKIKDSGVERDTCLASSLHSFLYKNLVYKNIEAEICEFLESDTCFASSLWTCPCARNTSTRMFPRWFPVLPHGKHCFQRQFLFPRSKICFYYTAEKKFRVSARHWTTQDEETIMETCFRCAWLKVVTLIKIASNKVAKDAFV